MILSSIKLRNFERKKDNFPNYSIWTFVDAVVGKSSETEKKSK